MSHSTYFVSLPLLKRNNCCLITQLIIITNHLLSATPFEFWLIRHPLIWSKVISLSSTASVLKNGKIHLKFYVQFYSEFTYYCLCICTFYRQCSFPMKIDSESQAWSYPKLLYSFLSYLFKQHWMKQLNQTLLFLWLTTLELVT